MERYWRKCHHYITSGPGMACALTRMFRLRGRRQSCHRDQRHLWTGKQEKPLRRGQCLEESPGFETSCCHQSKVIGSSCSRSCCNKGSGKSCSNICHIIKLLQIYHNLFEIYVNFNILLSTLCFSLWKAIF